MAYKIKKLSVKAVPKAQLAFWIITRIALLCCAAYSFINGDIVMGFESVFCFIFISSAIAALSILPLYYTSTGFSIIRAEIIPQFSPRTAE